MTCGRTYYGTRKPVHVSGADILQFTVICSHCLFSSLHSWATRECRRRDKPHQNHPAHQERTGDTGPQGRAHKDPSRLQFADLLVGGLSNYSGRRLCRPFSDSPQEPDGGFLPERYATISEANALTHMFVGKQSCLVCNDLLVEHSQSLLFLFLCRHVVHSRCVSKQELLPHHFEFGHSHGGRSGVSGKIAMYVAYSCPFFAQQISNNDNSTALIRARLDHGCPICQKRAEGTRT